MKCLDVNLQVINHSVCKITHPGQNQQLCEKPLRWGVLVLRPAKQSMRVVLPAPVTPIKAVRTLGLKAPLMLLSSCSCGPLRPSTSTPFAGEPCSCYKSASISLQPSADDSNAETALVLLKLSQDCISMSQKTPITSLPMIGNLSLVSIHLMHRDLAGTRW